jgi:electron transfer flavoprotein alpha subunit
MEILLFLAHTEPDGTLAKPALEALASAQTLAQSLNNAPLVVGLMGPEVQAAADSIASCGATRFIGVRHEALRDAHYATDAAAAQALCAAAHATIVIAAHTSRFARAMSGVALRLNGRVDTHVSGIPVNDGKVATNRWYYRQRIEGTLQRNQRPWIMLMDAGSSVPFQGTAKEVAVEMLPSTLGAETQRTRVTGFQSPPANQQTIRPEAALLFVTGAGWTKKQADGQPHVKEAETLIMDFLHVTRASLGSSKSLVDLSGEGQAVLPFLTHLNQIGQTGSTPRHQKGLSTCCHGEEPHTVGWRFINERRAINLDPNCGWARGKADVLYVADAFAVMSKLNAMLAQK